MSGRRLNGLTGREDFNAERALVPSTAEAGRISNTVGSVEEDLYVVLDSLPEQPVGPVLGWRDVSPQAFPRSGQRCAVATAPDGSAWLLGWDSTAPVVAAPAFYFVVFTVLANEPAFTVLAKDIPLEVGAIKEHLQVQEIVTASGGKPSQLDIAAGITIVGEENSTHLSAGQIQAGSPATMTVMTLQAASNLDAVKLAVVHQP